MSIVAISRAGYLSEEKNVMTENGVIVVENLVPGNKDSSRLKNAETELYRVYSKYRKDAAENDILLAVRH